MYNEGLHGSASDQLSLGEGPKFLCGVAVSVYQNSGTASAATAASSTAFLHLMLVAVVKGGALRGVQATLTRSGPRLRSRRLRT